MNYDELIPAEDFCVHHNIEYSFISSLQNSGLISVTSVKSAIYIHPEEIGKIEKFIRLHYDLDINIEGIETISYLLEKIQRMQEEIVSLRNRI
ncbi:MAG TPA: chaperone modulator CbpM [Chitinophagaceae bacterium]|nr:chaperone modulator CbpM [Chitinophagaceae bacterium]